MHHYLWFIFLIVISMHECCLFFSKIWRDLNNFFFLFQSHIWPWISGRLKKKGKTEKFFSSSSISIVLSINIMQAWKSETSGAETMQGREAEGLVGMGQVNLTDFLKSLAYPHLKMKAEDMDGSYAIPLTFSCVAFSILCIPWSLTRTGIFSGQCGNFVYTYLKFVLILLNVATANTQIFFSYWLYVMTLI